MSDLFDQLKMSKSILLTEEKEEDETDRKRNTFFSSDDDDDDDNDVVRNFRRSPSYDKYKRFKSEHLEEDSMTRNLQQIKEKDNNNSKDNAFEGRERDDKLTEEKKVTKDDSESETETDKDKQKIQINGILKLLSEDDDDNNEMERTVKEKAAKSSQQTLDTNLENTVEPKKGRGKRSRNAAAASNKTVVAVKKQQQTTHQKLKLLELPPHHNPSKLRVRNLRVRLKRLSPEKYLSSKIPPSTKEERKTTAINNNTTKPCVVRIKRLTMEEITAWMNNKGRGRGGRKNATPAKATAAAAIFVKPAPSRRGRAKKGSSLPISTSTSTSTEKIPEMNKKDSEINDTTVVPVTSAINTSEEQPLRRRGRPKRKPTEETPSEETPATKRVRKSNRVSKVKESVSPLATPQTKRTSRRGKKQQDHEEEEELPAIPCTSKEFLSNMMLSEGRRNGAGGSLLESYRSSPPMHRSSSSRRIIDNDIVELDICSSNRISKSDSPLMMSPPPPPHDHPSFQHHHHHRIFGMQHFPPSRYPHPHPYADAASISRYFQRISASKSTTKAMKNVTMTSPKKVIHEKAHLRDLLERTAFSVSNRQLRNKYGTNIFMSYVKISRPQPEDYVHLPRAMRPRRHILKFPGVHLKKTKQLSVSFQEQVEIFGSSSSDDDDDVVMMVEEKNQDNKDNVDDGGTTLINNRKPFLVDGSLMSSTPASNKRLGKKRSKPIFSPLKDDTVFSPRQAQLKLANEKLPSNVRIRRHIPHTTADSDDDDEDVELELNETENNNNNESIDDGGNTLVVEKSPEKLVSSHDERTLGVVGVSPRKSIHSQREKEVEEEEKQEKEKETSVKGDMEFQSNDVGDGKQENMHETTLDTITEPLKKENDNDDDGDEVVETTNEYESIEESINYPSTTELDGGRDDDKEDKQETTIVSDKITDVGMDSSDSFASAIDNIESSHLPLLDREEFGKNLGGGLQRIDECEEMDKEEKVEGDHHQMEDDKSMEKVINNNDDNDVKEENNDIDEDEEEDEVVSNLVVEAGGCEKDLTITGNEEETVNGSGEVVEEEAEDNEEKNNLEMRNKTETMKYMATEEKAKEHQNVDEEGMLKVKEEQEDEEEEDVLPTLSIDMEDEQDSGDEKESVVGRKRLLLVDDSDSNDEFPGNKHNNNNNNQHLSQIQNGVGGGGGGAVSSSINQCSTNPLTASLEDLPLKLFVDSSNEPDYANMGGINDSILENDKHMK